jgi:hypothetical protein
MLYIISVVHRVRYMQTILFLAQIFYPISESVRGSRFLFFIADSVGTDSVIKYCYIYVSRTLCYQNHRYANKTKICIFVLLKWS